MDNFIGRIYDSNNFGKFRIIRELIYIRNINDSKERMFEIEFLNTGYRTDASYSAIRHGRVKDKLYPSVANVGYIGYTDKVTSKENHSMYKVWNDMINRCYNKLDYDYHLYGGIGITVEESWFNFTTFLNDVKLLPGYENKLKYPTIYQLDKDYLQLDIPKSQRIYSKNTCMWISKHDNIMIMNRENPNVSEYYGVIFKDGAYCTKINNKIYGRFTTAEAAANLFNHIYPALKNEFNNIMILNNVRYIPFEELSKYTINKNVLVQRLSVKTE